MKSIALVLMFWLVALPVSAWESPYCQTCERDDYGKIKRSAQAKRDFQRHNPCPSTGKNRGGCPGYDLDHIKPLWCGGADVPENMQWLTKAEHKRKTRRERRYGCFTE